MNKIPSISLWFENSFKSQTNSLFLSRPRTTIDDVDVPRYDIKQADVTPLMSSLIGTAIPTNNVGRLPVDYLEVPEVRHYPSIFYLFSSIFNDIPHLFQEYACKSVLHNAYQISKQFKHLQNQYKKAFLFKDFQELNENKLLSIEYEIQSAFKAKFYGKAVSGLN